MTATHTLRLTGMTCTGCASRIESVLQSQPGVVSAKVNFALAEAWVTLSPEGDLEAIICAVQAAGYDACLVTLGKRRAEGTPWQDIGLLLAVIIIVMALSMGPFSHAVWVSTLMMILPVVLAVKGHWIFRQAFAALRRGQLHMSSLTVLGSSLSYVAGWMAWSLPTWRLGHPAHLWEASTMILAFVQLGRAIETVFTQPLRRHWDQLTTLHAESAKVLGPEGQFIEMPLNQIAVGAVICVDSLAKIPLDGQVLEGESWVNTSMLTGELMPVWVKPGSYVTGGTFNDSAELRIKVKHTVSDGLLARLIDQWKDIQSSATPASRLVDRWASLMIGLITLLSGLTFISWILAGASTTTALTYAISVMVVSCPCALGLAMPLAMSAAMMQFSRLGVVPAQGIALECLALIDTVVWDKTGTLTEGNPVLKAVNISRQSPVRDEKSLLELVTSVARYSQHPLSRCLTVYARQLCWELLPVESPTEVPGEGVFASVSGHDVHLVGRKRASDKGIPNDLSVKDEGLLEAWIIIDGRVSAKLGFEDAIRPSAIDSIASLKARGIHNILMTGDQRANAERLATSVGIDEVLSELHPEDKFAGLRQLKAEGRCVAMVGDGLNDALALSAADIGIALGQAASPVTVASAELFLMSHDLGRIPQCLSFAQRVQAVITQNLGFAVLYNALMIPIAAGLLQASLGLSLSPTMSSAAMMLSSLTVILNSMRLSRLNLNSCT